MRNGPLFVLQMAGQPGSGKSTLARGLAENFGAVVIDKDILKSSVLIAGGEEHIAAVGAYEAFFDLGHSFVAQGFSVILDSPSYAGGNRPDIPRRGREIADKFNVPYCWIECVCGIDRLAMRVDSRVRRASQYETSTSLDMTLESDVPQGIEVLRVDTEEPLENYLQESVDYIYRRYRDEKGLEVEPSEIIGTYSRPLSNAHLILLRVETKGGELIRSNREISELRFFEKHQLPKELGPGGRACSKDAFSEGTGYLRSFNSLMGEYE